MLMLIVPALQLMLTGSMWQFLAGQLLMAVPVAMALGMQGAMLTEIFPLRTRVTSMSFAYGMTLALAGGSAPLVSAWLVEEFGHPIAPAWYIMGYGLLGLALLLPMKETNTRALDA
jgi:MHS family proline/betaine transporter-like MFS transporter